MTMDEWMDKQNVLCIYTQQNIIQPLKRKEILTYEITQMDLEDKLSEIIPHKKTNTV